MRPKPDVARPEQESVWAFPRPAIVQPIAAHITIQHAGKVIVDTRSSIRTIETSHPPTYYIPPGHIAPGTLRIASGSSFCEWKGVATYWDVIIDGVVLPRAGWSYPDPSPSFVRLRNHVAFYARPFDFCSVDDDPVEPQPGGFYGGWITNKLAGPFKGAPGTLGW